MSEDAAPYAVVEAGCAEFFDTEEQAALYAAIIGGHVYQRKSLVDGRAYYERIGSAPLFIRHGLTPLVPTPSKEPHTNRKP